MKRSAASLFLAFFASLAAACSSPSEFSLTDTNHDNKLSHEEVETRLVQALFGKEDLNNDRKISAGEWTQVNPDSEFAIFEKRDLNGDKVVGFDELKKHVDSSGLLDKLLNKVDFNDDDFVSPSEINRAQSASLR